MKTHPQTLTMSGYLSTQEPCQVEMWNSFRLWKMHTREKWFAVCDSCRESVVANSHISAYKWGDGHDCQPT